MARSHLGPPASRFSDRTAEVGSTVEAWSDCSPAEPGKQAGIIALIDPRPLTRFATSEMLATALPHYEIMAAATCDELLAIQEGSANRPRLVIVDVRCSGLADAAARHSLQLLQQQLPEAPVIALSDRDDANGVLEALALGLRGYIPTATDPEVAFAAVELVYAGGTFIPPNALSACPARSEDDAEDNSANGHDAVHALDLTTRELSVLHLLREGRPNKLIARQLRMQESTVKVHVRSIMRKLKATNRTQAAFLADRIFTANSPHSPRITAAPKEKASATADSKSPS